MKIKIFKKNKVFPNGFVMTNLQFIELLKRAFFEYFFMKKAGKKPSLMNLEDLIEIFRNQVIEQYKNQQDELNNDKK